MFYLNCLQPLYLNCWEYLLTGRRPIVDLQQGVDRVIGKHCCRVNLEWLFPVENSLVPSIYSVARFHDFVVDESIALA